MEKKNEALSGLTEEQRDRVRDWIEEGVGYRDIAKLIEKPEPDGFGIKVSHSAVGRFAKNDAKMKFLAELGEDEAAAKELMRLTAEGAVDFGKATMQILQRQVFKAAAEAKGEAACEMLRKLSEIEQRQQRIVLAERNHDLSKLRFQMNTSRELMKKARAYIEVYSQPGVDDESKLWQARQICFGADSQGEKEAKLLTTESITADAGQAEDTEKKGEARTQD